MAVFGLAVTFDPVVDSGNSTIWTLLLVYDQLVRVSKDGLGVEPDLAESWDISKDGRVYTFHLRPNLKFSDGSPLRASDVRFSLERVAKDAKSIHTSLFPPFAVKTPDDQTVTLELEQPWAPTLAVLSLFSVSIIPQAYFEQVGRERFSEAPIGSGPFVVAEFRRGDRVVLRRNPHHWNPRYPYLDEVHFIRIPDEMTRIFKIWAGEVDVAQEIPFSQVEMLRRAPGVDVQVAPIMRADYLRLNHHRPELRDIKVRQAIDWAINREALVKTMLFGHGEVSSSFLPRMMYTDPRPSRYDLAKARQLLSESAYPGGFAARLLAFPGSPDKDVAVVLQSELGRLGIRVDIQHFDNAQAWQRRTSGDFEMILEMGTTSDTFDPAQLVEGLVASTSSYARQIGYSNPKVDELAVKARGEMNPARRAEMYLDIQRAVRDDAVLIGLFRAHSRTAVRDDVHGFAVLPTANYRLWEVWKSP